MADDRSVGAELFEERLRRCTAIPPDQRSPDVAAFVEGQQLLAEARALLPLTADGQPALAPTQTNLQQALSGVLCIARAFYLSPSIPVDAHGEQRHLGTYFSVSWIAAIQRTSGVACILAPTLLMTIVGYATSAQEPQDLAFMLSRLQDFEDPLWHGQYERQLARLHLPRAVARACRQPRGQPILSATQLRHLVCCSLIRWFRVQEDQVVAGKPPPDAAQRAELRAAALSVAQQLLRLEPSTPKSWGMACLAQSDVRRAAALFLRGAELARQQGSDFWQISSSSHVIALREAQPAGLPLASTEALRSTLLNAKPALRRCKRLLPMQWVRLLETEVECTLILLQPDQADESVEQAAAQNRMLCTGCDRRAIGLRCCARCKAAWYCRCVSPAVGLVYHVNCCCCLGSLHGRAYTPLLSSTPLALDGCCHLITTLCPPLSLCPAESSRWPTGSATSPSAAAFEAPLLRPAQTCVDPGPLGAWVFGCGAHMSACPARMRPRLLLNALPQALQRYMPRCTSAVLWLLSDD